MKRFALAMLVVASISTFGCAAHWGMGGKDTAGGGSIMTSQTFAGVNEGTARWNSEKFQILGDVTHETVSDSLLGWIAGDDGNGGYAGLLAAAKSQHSSAKDVAFIRTDIKYNNLLGLMSDVTIVWHAKAISY